MISEIGRSEKLFNQANEHWHRHQSFLLDGNDERATEACVEVVRLCQQAISASPKNGDAYVLLANALISGAYRCNLPLDQKRYEFLLTRAAAVIHFWYCLPHRGYPITRNKEIGERLWRSILEQLMYDKALTENPVIALMSSYKDNFAAEAISPSSFLQIREIVLQTVKMQEPVQSELQQQLLEKDLQPETWDFLASIVSKAFQGEPIEGFAPADPRTRLQATADKLWDFSSIRRTSTELLERWEQAYKNNDFRQAIGWITWHIILNSYEKIRIPELSAEVDKTMDQTKLLFEATAAITSKAVHLKDWDTLLLSIGICEWAKMQGSRDELLQILYDKVSKEEIYRRLSNIEHQPRMAIERFLVLYLQHYLGSCNL